MTCSACVTLGKSANAFRGVGVYGCRCVGAVDMAPHTYRSPHLLIEHLSERIGRFSMAVRMCIVVPLRLQMSRDVHGVVRE